MQKGILLKTVQLDHHMYVSISSLRVKLILQIFYFTICYFKTRAVGGACSPASACVGETDIADLGPAGQHRPACLSVADPHGPPPSRGEVKNNKAVFNV